jgi:hypothetical protein
MKYGNEVAGIVLVDPADESSTVFGVTAGRWIKFRDCFDLWVNVWRKKCAQGEVVVIRYADDSAPRRRGEKNVM